ncbi:hypothetical protein DND58_26220 [Pseudomonas syringae pv. pisi]|nr:hypothetical protein DND58_26220 [Pseudomonas syringae pv. pisi]PYD26364.1 hypothetical protein DND67_25495 [Pseudomonas syringae pv. pisi]
MSDELIALVMPDRYVPVAITKALNDPTLFNDGQGTQPNVVLNISLTATAVPARQSLTCFARQDNLPASIDAVGQQRKAGKRMQCADSGQRIAAQSWVSLSDDTSRHIVCLMRHALIGGLV